MIVLDTSALMALIVEEAGNSAVAAALGREDERLISAATIAELFVVASRRNVFEEVQLLVGGLNLIGVPLTDALARSAADAYRPWSKSFH